MTQDMVKLPRELWRGKFGSEGVFRIVFESACADSPDHSNAFVDLGVERLERDAMGGDRWVCVTDDAREDEDAWAVRGYVVDRLVAALALGKTVDELDEMFKE